MTLLYYNTVFDDLMKHSEEEKQRKIAAFIYNLERLLQKAFMNTWAFKSIKGQITMSKENRIHFYT